mgnify:CR=1 FL=1
MASEDFDKLPIRRVADLESRAKNEPWQPTRRQFLGVCGAVAGGAVAARLGLNWLAPDVVPGPKTVKYLTAEEFTHQWQLDSNGRIINIIGYAPGDTIYIKDRPRITTGTNVVNINYGGVSEKGFDISISKDNNPEKKYDGKLVIVTTSVISGRDCERLGYEQAFGDSTLCDGINATYDQLNKLGKNTIKLA